MLAASGRVSDCRSRNIAKNNRLIRRWNVVCLVNIHYHKVKLAKANRFVENGDRAKNVKMMQSGGAHKSGNC